ncbi:MAG: glycosyl transferase, partial [Bacteroidetes bacterium QH_2_63_10]
FHQLDDEKFLSLMARCRGFVSTAGFESIAEAMYLGKPVQVVPVDGHFEQLCNALDTVRARAGIRSRRFDIDQLRAFLPQHTADAEPFRQWVCQSRTRFGRAIEAAAECRPGPVRSSVPEPDVSVLGTAG